MTTQHEHQPNEELYFEDLHVGLQFRSGSHAIDEAQIKSFAGQFDPQPFHLDDATAKRTLFQGLGGEWLAHGGDHHAAHGRRRSTDCGRHRRCRWGSRLAEAHATRRHPPRRKRSAGGDPVALAPRPGNGHHPQRDQKSARRGRADVDREARGTVPPRVGRSASRRAIAGSRGRRERTLIDSDRLGRRSKSSNRCCGPHRFGELERLQRRFVPGDRPHFDASDP